MGNGHKGSVERPPRARRWPCRRRCPTLGRAPVRRRRRRGAASLAGPQSPLRSSADLYTLSYRCKDGTATRRGVRMTDLEIRRIPFAFDRTVPFQWNPSHPAFAIGMNTLSFIAVSFEKYIVAAVHQAQELINDPTVAAEADAFLRQEAQHARAHRGHLKALIEQYPGLKEVENEAIASFDRLLETKSLKFHLAYIAALEATFAPGYTRMLEQRETLLVPGDDRVASLLAWHFVEELEHRSSALVIYNHVIGNAWYKATVAPRALA